MVWKVAIIDDERQVLQGMKRAIPWGELEAEWVGEALNGVDGLNMIREKQPDIVITDIYMPLMNGLDMIERLRNEAYYGKIIILSGYSDFEYARQAIKHNVSDYVSKPISIPTLRMILNKVIQELIDEEEKLLKQGELQDKLMQYEPFIEKEWVRSAIIGTLDISYRNEKDLPPKYRFWTNSSHAVMAIELVRDERASTYSVSDWNLFRFAVSNIVCELAYKMFPFVEYTELHSTRFVLIIHPDQNGSGLAEQAMEDLGIQIIQSIMSCLKLVSRIGIGSTKAEWFHIPNSTEEAFRAIDMRFKRKSTSCELFVYEGFPKSENEQTVLFPVKFSYELANAMKTVQEIKAQQLVADYISELGHQKGITPDYVQMLGSELWGIICYCLYEAGHVLDHLVTNDQIAKELKSLSQPEQLQKWLSDKISMVCNSRQWKGSSKHREIVEFMTDYIHEHYADDVTLADLSEKVFISRNHLSIIFKNITGETFNTYLTRVRIEKARELLMERQMLVYEVAERVGYKNIPYFSTLFKKMTGMNPTDFIK